MEPNHNHDRLDLLKRRLYHRGEDDFTIKRTSLEADPTEVPKKWQGESTGGGVLSLRLLRRLLMGALIFFIVAIGFAGVMWSKGSNLISESKIRIAVQAPTTVRAGDITNFEILINNRNKEDLFEAELIIEYPAGTRSPNDLSVDLPHERQVIGPIPQGSTVSRSVRAAFFGESGTSQEIRIRLEYRVKDANNVFEKEVSQNFTLSASPISLVIESPLELNPEQEIELIIKAKSNVTSDLERVVIVANYPPGFQLTGAMPGPTGGKNIWEISKLEPGETREIKLKGAMVSQSNEAKTFRFSVGVTSADKPGVISVPYGESLATINIKRPFISANFSLDGKSAEEVAVRAERNLRGEIRWENSLPDRVIDGQVELKIMGRALDRSSVTVDGGFYRSSDNTIIWNKSTWRDFASLAPGSKGTISFGLASVPLVDANGQPIKNPQLDLTLIFRGTRVAEGFPNEPLESVITKRVKIESTFQLAARALYGSGPLENEGPLPPQVDKRTTYTIDWSVTNTSNSVGSSVVRATLPTYVEWVGNVSPNTERVTYSEWTREVSWDIGSIPPGTGVGLPAEHVAFRVALIPSLSQLGSVVQLVNPATLSGIDAFTKTTISDVERELDTRLLSDPTFKIGQEIVSQ